MTPPDIRGFYAALGVQLPASSTIEAPTRCLANPEAHRHGDRNPSCSVNLQHGAWNCHACGAKGGAYDAAIALGHTPRSAMDLLTAHGLTEPRVRSPGEERRSSVSQATSTTAREGRRMLTVDEGDIRRWMRALSANSSLLRQLMINRAWSPQVMRELQLGSDGFRITIPVRDETGSLRGILRYDPFGRREPKMVAVPGTRLGLVPHPSREPSDQLLLVEGPPDMIAARSSGLSAIAIPGTGAWNKSWATLLTGKRIRIVMDCDVPGRRAATEIAEDLRVTAKTVEVVDLWPDRQDGYDLTDRILERRRARSGPLTIRTVRSLLRPVGPVTRGRRACPASEAQ